MVLVGDHRLFTVITNNEILYQAVLQQSFINPFIENVLNEDGMEMNEIWKFVNNYMSSRYGKFIIEFQDNEIFGIYSELLQIVYQSYYEKWGVTRSLIVMRPSIKLLEYNISDVVMVNTKHNKVMLELNGEPEKINQRWRISQFQSNYIDYNFCKIFEHWKRWIIFIQKFKYQKLKYLTMSPAFTNDIAEVTRQVLSDLFLQLYILWKNKIIANNYVKNDNDPQIQIIEDIMIDIIEDTDLLMSYFDYYRLDTWINNARSYGDNDINEEMYLELNARNLITRWGPNGEITEYASREWNGLMNNYYKQRWMIFFKGEGWKKIQQFEVDWQYQQIDELELDNNWKQNGYDFTAFYSTLNDIYEKYRVFIDCKQPIIQSKSENKKRKTSKQKKKKKVS